MLSNTKSLAPVINQGHAIRRSASMVDEQPVVLFHKSGRALSPEGDYDWLGILAHLNCGEVTALTSSTMGWAESPSMNFNCHALAIGSQVGIGPADWLEGIASDATMNVNPTEVLLNCYYDQLRVEEPDHAGSFFDAQENDIVVLCDSTSQHFIHSAVVKFLDGKMVAVSKFGEGPILATSLELLVRFYESQFDEVHWYRFNDDPRKACQPRPMRIAG